MPAVGRPLLAAALLALAAPAPAAAACATVPAGWQPHVAAARAYARQRQGLVTFAARTDRRLVGWRMRHTVNTASLLKPMLLAAYLNRPAVREVLTPARNRPLSRSRRAPRQSVLRPSSAIFRYDGGARRPRPRSGGVSA